MGWIKTPIKKSEQIYSEIISERPTWNENLVGEVFNDGVEKRGKWDMRATFYTKDGDATEYRVCEYFGFHRVFPNAYWKRWA